LQKGGRAVPGPSSPNWSDSAPPPDARKGRCEDGWRILPVHATTPARRPDQWFGTEGEERQWDLFINRLLRQLELAAAGYARDR